MSTYTPVIGDDIVIPLTFTHPTTLAAIDITGYTIAVKIWANDPSGDEQSIDKTATIDDGPAGLASIAIDAADWAPWAAVPWGRTVPFSYEVQRTNGAGKILTPSQGTFKMSGQKIT